jgi:uncharacterized peroxidase-related enzyme
MTHINQKKREDLPELEPMFAMVEASMGFIPNSFLTMAHWPELIQSFGPFAGTILGPGEVDSGLKQLIAYVASNASGCRYCQAHTSHVAEKRGVSVDKISEAFEFETSSKFDDAERAALRVALYGAITPNQVEPSHMEDLASHYSEKQIVEIVSVISLFGFLNRWNDTMATTLEDKPNSFAAESLTASGWDVGKHVAKHSD